MTGKFHDGPGGLILPSRHAEARDAQIRAEVERQVRAEVERENQVKMLQRRWAHFAELALEATERAEKAERELARRKAAR